MTARATALVVWLGLGGFAFGVAGPELRQQNSVLPGAIICALLGPFAAGAVVAELVQNPQKS